MIDGETLLRFGLALALVLALIAGLAALAKRGLLGVAVAGATGKRRRLSVVESLTLDGRARAVLIRRDAVEHLVVVGPHGALLVERAIALPAPEPTAP